MGALNKAEMSTVKFEGSTEKICQRTDQRNLVQDWLSLGEKSFSKNRVFVQNREQLLAVKVKEVDHVMGLFRNNHLTYSVARQEGEPSLREMVQTVLGVIDF